MPTEPRLNKTGARKVNNLKAVDTTYELLLAFLETEAPDLMDDPEHRMRLAELRDENRFYYRESIVPSDEYLANALDDIEQKAELLNFSLEKNYFPRTYHTGGIRSCERCSMASICRAELLDWDTEAVLEAEYEPRDTSYKDYETDDE